MYIACLPWTRPFVGSEDAIMNKTEMVLPSETLKGLPRWLNGKESACSAGDAGDVVRSLGWEDPLEKEMLTHPSILA